MATSPRIYQFKISIAYIKPPIWRRVQVPENYSFLQFHHVIVSVMGWKDKHLHQFTCGERGSDFDIGVPFSYDFDQTKDETATFLNQYFVRPKDKMKYVYDLSDSWHHNIELEKILPAEDGKVYPVCIGGRRACPREDHNGFTGDYYDLDEIMYDSSDPDYEEMANDRIGLEKWDAEKFDPKEVVF